MIHEAPVGATDDPTTMPGAYATSVGARNRRHNHTQTRVSSLRDSEMSRGHLVPQLTLWARFLRHSVAGHRPCARAVCRSPCCPSSRLILRRTKTRFSSILYHLGREELRKLFRERSYEHSAVTSRERLWRWWPVRWPRRALSRSTRLLDR